MLPRALLLTVMLAACSFPSRSEGFACQTTEDCESGRACENRFCVLSSTDAGAIDTTADASAEAIDAAVDAAPRSQDFTVGNECSSGHCTGGYNGQKNDAGPPTADHVCTTHSFPRASSFAISNNQPGGRFCSFNPGTQTFSCDGSCSGCNAIVTVTCADP